MRCFIVNDVDNERKLDVMLCRSLIMRGREMLYCKGR